ncbi:MAG: DUF4175 family protein [Polyangiaceae bacterium]|nr:DUF4175 family protein [Polyangiaceae bacterium]
MRSGGMLEAIVALSSRIRALYRETTGTSKTTLAVVLALASVLAAAHLGRLGTRDARLGAFAVLILYAVVVVALAIASRRRWRNPRRVLRREIGADDPELAARIDRAAGLVHRTRSEGAHEGVALAEPAQAQESATAQALSELHLARQLERVKLDRLTVRAEKHARWIAAGAFAFAVASMAIAAMDPFRIVEGLDVLAARNGEAPFRLLYLDDVDVVATPPGYIGRHEELLANFDRTDQPRGTVLTVRGKPERPGRKLVLTDGTKEIAFVDDGHGNVVARWPVEASTDLRVAAKFGDARISQRDALTVVSIEDEAPIVALTGAPKTVKLVDVPRLTLEYSATDDHGLTEIALVLRSGGNEESRTLSKPSGLKLDRGAHELSTQEPFFRGTHVPVEVTIEAKDNDAVLGPKWGVSPAFIVLPPLVGEPEALRYAALLKARDVLVDLLAPRVLASVKTAADAKSRVASEKEAQDKAMETVEEVLAGSYGGLGIRGRVRRVIAGQTRRLREALGAFADKPDVETFDKLVKTNEQVVLAIDAAIQRAGVDDAKKVAKALADVAKEAGDASSAAQSEAERDRGLHRIEAALGVLGEGGKELAKIGTLGADLGDITVGGVGRIDRERATPNLPGAELAARDLERRLRDPVASIGGGGRVGVESGAGDGTDMGDPEDASEADEQAEKSGKELDELIKRHQDELDRVEKALERATTPEEREALKKLAKEQAKEIREAVKDLPDHGFPGSAAEKAAEGKKSADSMAGSLEKGNVKDAIKKGKDALDALREAKKRGDKEAFLDDAEVGKDATSAGNRVEEALDALEKALKSSEENAKERAKKDMDSAGQNEGRLSERTRDLRKRGEEGDSSMPDEVLDRLERAEKAMKEAEKALRDGDADKGREKQKEAQRQLEMAHEDEDPNESSRQKDGQDGEDEKFSQDAEVPDKDTHKGPEEFRKRVTEGLSKPGESRLKDAVKRYAEGLLK